MNRDEFRALTPWSFFLPMALAVALGVLVANGLGTLFFGSNDSASAPSVQVEGGKPDAAAVANPGPAPAGADAPATAGVAGASGGKPAAATPPTLEPVSLPGPSSARRDGELRACIGGTVAVRAANGWEQEVVEDAPARCTAASP